MKKVKLFSTTGVFMGYSIIKLAPFVGPHGLMPEYAVYQGSEVTISNLEDEEKPPSFILKYMADDAYEIMYEGAIGDVHGMGALKMSALDKGLNVEKEMDGMSKMFDKMVLAHNEKPESTGLDGLAAILAKLFMSTRKPGE